MDYQAHWDKVYRTKQPREVSWTQEIPRISLRFIHSFHLPKSAPIIDVGGGDSKLVDHLLQEGYEDITVVDISINAIERTKIRLGKQAERIHWLVSDITNFRPERTYKLWHDRATFHFLTTTNQISKYVNAARTSVDKDGFAIISTFSTKGPEKCSGLEIKQYSEELLSTQLKLGFEKLKCITEDHITPFNAKQNFLFCSFRRI